MRIELGKIPQQFVTLPKFLLSVTHPRQHDTPHLVIGQLYAGYAGLHWVNRLFSLTLWITKDQDYLILGRRLGTYFRA